MLEVMRESCTHFVVEYCFPSQGQSAKESQCWVIKEPKTKAISTFMAPNKRPMNTLPKQCVDFMSGCGCGRAIVKCDGDLAVVAVQEAVKNSRQSDTSLEINTNGGSQSNGAAGERSEGGRRNDTNVEGVRFRTN